jgi:antitoxin VapB
MWMILGRSLMSLNVKSSRPLRVRRTSDQMVYRRDDNSRRTVQNVPADSWERRKCHRCHGTACLLTTDWHILVYMASRTAKVFMNNRSQAVRLPKEFQFDTSEVYIRKEGDDVILSPRPKVWDAYLASGPVASDEFMEDVEDLPVQERER